MISSPIIGMHTLSLDLNNARGHPKSRTGLAAFLRLEYGLDDPQHLIIGHATHSGDQNAHTYLLWGYVACSCLFPPVVAVPHHLFWDLDCLLLLLILAILRLCCCMKGACRCQVHNNTVPVPGRQGEVRWVNLTSEFSSNSGILPQA